MKIGILTFYNTTNYGALLQAYALQNKIHELGKECEIIRYDCEEITKREKAISFLEIRSIKELIKYIVLNSSQKKKFNKFIEFEQNFMMESKDIYDKNNIKESSEEYDLFIVGSDQVWNLSLSGDDYSFFLDFERDNEKKRAYAASFGYSQVPNKYLKNTEKYLKDFSKIAVREESGKAIVNSVVKKDAVVVLDPTLLLTKEEWFKVSSYKPKYEKYILLYFIHNKKETFKFARKLAKEKGLKLVYINISPKVAMGMKNLRSASPEEFIGLVKNAEYVITGSFHGVAFSINFNKEFFYETNKSKENYNSRIDNLIKILKLENRNINLSNSFDEEIDYKKVNNLLSEARENSINVLKEITEI